MISTLELRTVPIPEGIASLLAHLRGRDVPVNGGISAETGPICFLLTEHVARPSKNVFRSCVKNDRA